VQEVANFEGPHEAYAEALGVLTRRVGLAPAN